MKKENPLLREHFISQISEKFPNLTERQAWSCDENVDLLDRMRASKIHGEFFPGVVVYDGSHYGRVYKSGERNGLTPVPYSQVHYLINLMKFFDGNLNSDLILFASFKAGKSTVKQIIDALLEHFSIADHWSIFRQFCNDGKFVTISLIKSSHNPDRIVTTKNRDLFLA